MDPFTANKSFVVGGASEAKLFPSVLDGMFGLSKKPQRNYDDPLQDTSPSSSRVGILKVGGFENKECLWQVWLLSYMKPRYDKKARYNNRNNNLTYLNEKHEYHVVVGIDKRNNLEAAAQWAEYFRSLSFHVFHMFLLATNSQELKSPAHGWRSIDCFCLPDECLACTTCILHHIAKPRLTVDGCS